LLELIQQVSHHRNYSTSNINELKLKCDDNITQTLWTPSVPNGRSLPFLSTSRISQSRIRSEPFWNAWGIYSFRCCTYNSHGHNLVSQIWPNNLPTKKV